jgi:hypothetical protein
MTASEVSILAARVEPAVQGPGIKGEIMKRHILFIFGYIFVSFLVQGTSHFALFAQHYAEVSILRHEPNFALGFASMVIQGAILSGVFMGSRFNNGKLMDAVRFAWLFGAFLVSYIALAEAGKYSVPSVASWFVVEAGAGAVQFTLAGVILGLVNRKPVAGLEYAR